MENNFHNHKCPQIILSTWESTDSNKCAMDTSQSRTREWFTIKSHQMLWTKSSVLTRKQIGVI